MKSVGPPKPMCHATKYSSMCQATSPSTMRNPIKTLSPCDVKGKKCDVLGLPRPTLGCKELEHGHLMVSKCLQRQGSSSHVSNERGAHHPTCGLHAPMKVQATLCLHDQAFTWQRPAKTNKYALPRIPSHKLSHNLYLPKSQRQVDGKLA
jgi:hypothetical protein